MAHLRVFISSTFYDLRHIRSSLEGFVERMGYEAVMSEKGRIAYDPDIPLDESCYREASSADIFVLIIGGRYGHASSDEDIKGKPDFYDRYESITKKEYDSAARRDIPIYILVERSVFSEYETYKKNKGNDTIEYAHVDSINVFQLLESILKKSRNNPVHQFERHTEIEEWLREQWAGFFRELINRRSDQKQLSSLTDRVAELSSINASLQRYMEAVVSRVSSTEEEANEIIKSEKDKLFADKQIREFLKVRKVNSLIESYDIDPNTVVDIFRHASSLENFAKKCEEETEGIDAEDALALWADDPEHIENINSARKILELPPLTFEKKKISRGKRT